MTARNTWRPMRTRNGLTLWTYKSGTGQKGGPVLTYAIVRRDKDGLVVAACLKPIRPGTMAALYDEFDATATVECAAFINGLDAVPKCAQCLTYAKPHTDALREVLRRYT